MKVRQQTLSLWNENLTLYPDTAKRNFSIKKNPCVINQIFPPQVGMSNRYKPERLTLDLSNFSSDPGKLS
jgi:hypothetical protein